LLEQANIYKRAFPYKSCHKLVFVFSYYCLSEEKEVKKNKTLKNKNKNKEEEKEKNY
jgi:hypothetical protein